MRKEEVVGCVRVSAFVFRVYNRELRMEVGLEEMQVQI